MAEKTVLLQEFERDESLVIPVTMSKEDLRTTLSKVRLLGGWRHNIHFSNGLSTSELETGKPWSDRPLNKIKMVERQFPGFAKHGGTALDIGSNIGYNSLYLAHQYGMSITGIDVTQSHLEVSQLFAQLSGLTNAEFMIGDAETFLRPDHYDLVVHFGTLYHLRNVIRALETTSKNLKIGGVLLLETQCHGEPGSMLSRYVRGFNNDPSNWWALGGGALTEILEYCGFGNISEVFRWTHPSLDGMYRIIWKMDKIQAVEKAYDDIS
jgi:SAM-dependent methyltransferase